MKKSTITSFQWFLAQYAFLRYILDFARSSSVLLVLSSKGYSVYGNRHREQVSKRRYERERYKYEHKVVVKFSFDIHIYSVFIC